jgi:hypothetical protein
MKTKLTQSVLMLFLLVGMFSMGVGRVEAKSVNWSSGNIAGPLAYYANCGGLCVEMWINGLKDFNVNIGYQAYAYNNNSEIIDGSSIAVGDIVSFAIRAQDSNQDTDISWSGTGRSLDTPFGHWLAGAVAPSSVNYAYDFVSTYFQGNQWWNIYIPLSVNPSTITYTHIGSTAALDCNGDNIADITPIGQSCKVISGGIVSTQVNYSQTYGKFYYHYNGSTGYVYYSTVALRKSTLVNDGTFFGSMEACMVSSPIGVPCNGKIESNDYTLTVPAQTISFSLTAVSNNNPPATPTLSVDASPKPINTNFAFTATSTDPDNDTIRYGFDWNNDNTVDQYVPGSGFVTSGTAQSSTYQWPLVSAYTVKVRAEDSKGGVSGWSTPVTVTTTNIINGACGVDVGIPSGSSPNPLGLCNFGIATIPVQSGSNWTWGCNGSGGGTSTLPNACVAPIQTVNLSVSKIINTGAAGIVTDVTIPTPTEPTLINCGATCSNVPVFYNSTHTLRGTPTLSTVVWTGCTSTSGNDCTVSSITTDKTVTATFNPNPQPGVCGSSNGGSTTDTPTSLCSGGGATAVALSGTTYSWNCNGLYGSGVNVSCSSTQTRNYNWVETAP